MNALDLAYAAAATILAPWWMRKTRGDWPARRGYTESLPPSTPDRHRLMLHAVSVGEVNALRHLVPLLAPHCDLVVSVGTDTGIARARDLFASQARVIRYPIDFSNCVRRFLDAVKPDAVGLVELELWPNFIRECRSRDIPVVVINGRLSERSFKGYHKLRSVLRRTFATLTHAAVQDPDYRERFLAMGVPADRCTITGSMKWDAAKIEDPSSVAAAKPLAAALGIDPSKPLIVAGSTAEDEEALLHAACPPGVQLLCAPRKPEHFDEAAAAMPGCVRRSKPGSGSSASGRFLLDTIGELRAAYALADIAVVGRSFGSLFGSDPIEPAALGKPVVIGPAVKDFQQIVATLESSGGIIRATRENLTQTLRSLLDSPKLRDETAAAARRAIVASQGASRRHADLLLRLLHRSAVPISASWPLTGPAAGAASPEG